MACCPLPTVRLNPAIKSLFDFTYADFELSNYQSHPGTRAPIAI
ncbi:MAG: thymidylate synthase [Mariprofundaceae bacterium]|nr:thymidylate synthase [Mariprofundaceae bacterium]